MRNLPSTKSAVLILACGLLAMRPSVSTATPVLSLNNPGSTTLHEIWVEPGETFEADLNLSTDVSLWWVQTAVSANASGVFNAESVTDNLPWDSQGHRSIIGDLDPQSGTLRTTFSPSALYGPGSTTVARIVFSVDSQSSTGTYTINIENPLYQTGILNPVEPSPASPGLAFVVQVIPEPAGSTLVLSSAFVLLTGRRA